MSDSIIQKFTTHLKNSLIKAHDFAQEFGHEYVTPAHLLYGLSAERGSISFELLKKVNFPVDLLKQELVRRHYTPYTTQPPQTVMNDDSIELLTKAIRTAHTYDHNYVGTEHVLACLLQWEQNDLQSLFADWQINLPELKHKTLVVLKSTSKFPDLSQTIRFLDSHEEDADLEHTELPVLHSVAKELTIADTSKKQSPLIGRDFQTNRIIQILGRKEKNNPLLVGKPGVGKTAIIEGLAQAINNHTAPGFLKNKRIFSLELGSMVAGTMYRGEFEQRMKSILDELKNNPDIILFIDEIHTLVGAGSTGQPLDAANMLKPALARGDLRCIGATTWEEYQAHLKEDKALSRRFQLINVPEPSKEETREILSGVKNNYETFHKVSITKQALESALDLSERYLTHTAWPDKALDLLDEAASHIVMNAKPTEEEKARQVLTKQLETAQKDKLNHLHEDDFENAFLLHKKSETILQKIKELSINKKQSPKLTEKHIQIAIAQRTGLNIERIASNNSLLSDELYNKLKQDIIGQDEALKKLSTNLQRSYSLLKEPQKPLGGFLLLGPSGVGKTTTAKSLAKHLFGSDQNLIKIDMSEYAERHTISKLVGSPAGYVGYQKSGLLTKAIEEQPLSVIVFDEVEKAHPDIFNLLLQILDDGTIRDGSGKKLDFRHSLILLTSNLGLKSLYSQLGFGNKDNQDDKIFTSSAKQFFNQELLNRLDDIIIFKHLGKTEREAIIKQKIQELDTRLGNFAELNISDEAISHLNASGYKQEEGVRSLQKAVRDQVEFILSNKLAKTKKGSVISIDVQDNKIVFA